MKLPFTSKKDDSFAPGLDLSSEWNNNPVEAVVAGLNATEKANLKERVRKWALIGAIGSAPLCLLGAFGAYNVVSEQREVIESLQKKVTTLEKRPTGGASKVDNSEGRYAAQQTLSSWLAAEPSPLPGGKMLYWTRSETVPSEGKSKSNERTLETFALTDGQGQGFEATVMVAIDPRGGAQAISGPSLTPIAGAATDDWANQDPWIGLKADEESTTQVDGATQSWALAYTSGDPQQLGLSVGDPNGEHTYQALSGVEKVTTNVTSVAKVKDKGDNTDTVARVEMVPEWTITEGDGKGADSDPIIMDVLLKDANTGAPKVVAWGAPGTGPSLKPYQNALSVPAEDLAQSEATTAPSESPSPTSSKAAAKTQTPSATATEKKD